MSDFVPTNNAHAMMARQDAAWQALGFSRCPRMLSSAQGLVPESVEDWEIVERAKALLRTGQLDGQRRLPITILDAQDGSIISTDGDGSIGQHNGDLRTLIFEKGRGWISAPMNDNAPSDDA